MKLTALGAAAMSVIGVVAVAQPAPTRSPSTQSAPPATTAPAPANPSTEGTAAASGNSNQAVATTNANAPTPARGANSFTEGEARRRIEARGYSNVSGLAQDDNGVWRSNAQKGSQQAQVWLDYKGNIGQQ
jgi:negative regulator of sigma E activity